MATKHLVIQGAIPLTATAVATAVALTTDPDERIIRLLHNLASGLLLGTVSAELFPDMIRRAMEGPANKLGTATGFMLAAFLSVLIYELRQQVTDPTPDQRRDLVVYRATVEASVLGFITGAVLFERRLDGVSVPYIIAAGVGVKAFVSTLLAAHTHSKIDPHSRRFRVSEGVGNMSTIATYFALAMAVVPLTARSVRPIYSLLMAFVTIQSVSLAINDLTSPGIPGASDNPSTGLSLRDYGEATMFYVGEALVLATSWVSHNARVQEALKRGMGGQMGAMTGQMGRALRKGGASQTGQTGQMGQGALEKATSQLGPSRAPAARRWRARS